VRLPVEVEIRQDEMRRAADASVERDPLPKRSHYLPQAPRELTLADDCAVMLEAWFATYTHSRRGHAAMVRRRDVIDLAEHMRELGKGPRP
jgi:hypothetical protein